MDLLSIAETERGALVERYPALAAVRLVVNPRPQRRLGCCRHGRETIVELSGCLSREAEHVVRDTVRHELAHAIAGPRAGHGPEWRMIARAIGAAPERCATGGAHVWQSSRIGYTCSGCGKPVHVGPRSRAARYLRGDFGSEVAARVKSTCCRAMLARDAALDRRGALVPKVVA